MGFLCPRMQQIHSTILEYFCSNTPVTFSTGPLSFLLLMMTGRAGGGGKEGEEGVWLSLSCCMSHAIFSRSLCYFVVFPFILQSKEYPRNVPGNRARKYVDKEVCMIWTQPIQCHSKKKLPENTKGKRKKKNCVVQRGEAMRSRSTNYSGFDLGNLQLFLEC